MGQAWTMSLCLYAVVVEGVCLWDGSSVLVEEGAGLWDASCGAEGEAAAEGEGEGSDRWWRPPLGLGSAGTA